MERSRYSFGFCIERWEVGVYRVVVRFDYFSMFILWFWVFFFRGSFRGLLKFGVVVSRFSDNED